MAVRRALVLAAAAAIVVVTLTLTRGEPDRTTDRSVATTPASQTARAPATAARDSQQAAPTASSVREDAAIVARRFTRALIVYERTGSTAALEADATRDLTIELASAPPRPPARRTPRARVAQLNVILDPADEAHATAVVVVRRGAEVGQGLELEMRQDTSGAWKVTAVG